MDMNGQLYLIHWYQSSIVILQCGAECTRYSMASGVDIRNHQSCCGQILRVREQKVRTSEPMLQIKHANRQNRIRLLLYSMVRWSGKLQKAALCSRCGSAGSVIMEEPPYQNSLPATLGGIRHARHGETHHSMIAMIAKPFKALIDFIDIPYHDDIPLIIY